MLRLICSRLTYFSQKVEIGGGELFRTIGVYKSKVPGISKVSGTSMSYITSADEFR